MGQTLRRDVTCANCGYNLRGLNDTGTCPECAASIADSLTDHGPAQRAWQRKLGQGAALTAIEYGVLMVLLPVAQFIDLSRLTVWAFGVMGLSAAAGAWWVGTPTWGSWRSAWRLRGAGFGILGLYGMAIAVDRGLFPGWEMGVTGTLVLGNMLKAGLQMWVLALAARRPVIRGASAFGPLAVVAAVLVWGLMFAEHWAHAQWLDIAVIGVAALSCGGLVAWLMWCFVATRVSTFGVRK